MVCRAAWVVALAAIGCSSAGGDPLESAAAGTSTTSSTGSVSDEGSSSSPIDDLEGTTTGGLPPASPSSGCGSQATVDEPLVIDGQDRTFVLHLPNDYDPDRAYPLVFAWHARGTTGSIAASYYYVEHAAADSAIFVYPNGLDIRGGGTGWELSADGYDMAFFDVLYAELTSKLCVDTQRVFSTGHSFGGYMSNAVGCYRGDVMRAIAPVAGGPPLTTDCVGEVAAWIAHGVSDPTVPIAEGEASRDHWTTQNACSAQDEPIDPAPCVAYLGCDPDHPVEWCAHDEVGLLEGHDWPSFAGEAIWAFFSRY